MFTENKNFYPTPDDLIEKMIEKVNWETVDYMLEPSAGKGDIVNYTRKYLANRKKKLEYTDKRTGEFITKEYDDPKRINVDCIEIDTDLRAILKDKHNILVGEDFLRHTGFTQYDLIMMNPPFDNGEKHLLKAIQTMKNGGQIVCILNSETIDNPYSRTRKELLYRLEELHADIEYVEDGFVDAERSTGVKTAIIYINIEPTRMTMDVFSNLVSSYKEVKEDDIHSNQFNQIAENDVIKSVVKQYELEAETGLKVISDFRKMQDIIPKSNMDKKSSDGSISLISLCVHYSKDYEESLSAENKFLRQLRFKFWSVCFQLEQMSPLFTNDVRERYQNKLEDFKQYDFTYSNIKQLQLDLNRNLDGNIKDAIIKLFDKLTYDHSMGKNNNIHYYNGWKTNKAFSINKKIIIPFYGLYDYGSFSLYKLGDYFTEFEKCLTYLDKGKATGENIGKILYQNEYQRGYDGSIIKCKYFDIQPKKKGTVHVWFTDLELLKKFNIFGSQSKGWLPPCYGKATYKDMNEEEKDVVNSFEGEKEYENTCSNTEYYLVGENNSMLMIGGR